MILIVHYIGKKTAVKMAAGSKSMEQPSITLVKPEVAAPQSKKKKISLLCFILSVFLLAIHGPLCGQLSYEKLPILVHYFSTKMLK